MDTLILTLHIVVCLGLILLVLLQSGKEGMGVIFGGGSSSLFGGSGAGGILVKLTTFLAVLFVVTSLTYNIMTSVDSGMESTLPAVEPVQIDEAPAPVTPLPENPGTATDTPAP